MFKPTKISKPDTLKPKSKNNKYPKPENPEQNFVKQKVKTAQIYKHKNEKHKILMT